MVSFYLRIIFAGALSGSPIPKVEPPHKGVPRTPRSNGSECRVIGTATARVGTLAITVDGEDTIGVIVGVDLERGAPESDNWGEMSWAIN